MAYPRFVRSRAHTYRVETSGDLTTNTTADTWTELAAATGGPGAGGFDLVLREAQVGDVIAATITGLAGAEEVEGWLDVKTIGPGGPASSFAGHGPDTATGPPFGPWHLPSGRRASITGTVLYVLEAGDVIDGTVRFRPYVALAASTDKTVHAGTGHPLWLAVSNLGPVQEPIGP